MAKSILSAGGIIAVLSLLLHLLLVSIPCVLSIVIPRKEKDDPGSAVKYDQSV